MNYLKYLENFTYRITLKEVKVNLKLFHIGYDINNELKGIYLNPSIADFLSFKGHNLCWINGWNIENKLELKTKKLILTIDLQNYVNYILPEILNYLINYYIQQESK